MQYKIHSGKILLFLIIVLSSINIQAQNDSILFEPGIAGYNYIYRGEKINGNRVLEILENNTNEYEQFKSANEAFVFGNIFSITGIIFILTPMGMKMAGYESNWSMAWAGGGLVIVSIPLMYKYNRNIPIALDSFNGTITAPKAEGRLKLNFGTTKNGIGLCLKF